MFYTIQYENKSNSTIIKAGNNHPYPRIDLQLANGHKKRIFENDASEYEARINTVLRYTEFYDTSHIGIVYNNCLI